SCSKLATTFSTPPSSLYGFVREVPSTVPPRGRIPEIRSGPSGPASPSTSPRQPSRTPTTSQLRSNDLRATARMTAFRPGQSPPPVNMPTRFATGAVLQVRGGRSSPGRTVPTSSGGYVDEAGGDPLFE